MVFEISKVYFENTLNSGPEVSMSVFAVYIYGYRESGVAYASKITP